jgi:monothiol glutaredoxin
VDRLSAARADGVCIDYVETPQGPAFKLDNPNEPPKVQPLSVDELKHKLDAQQELTLVDVRTPAERQIAFIPGSKLLDDETVAQLERLDRQHTLVFYCHHGMRSRQAAEQFVMQGFRNVFNVTGGIDAWSQTVDPSTPRY